MRRWALGLVLMIALVASNGVPAQAESARDQAIRSVVEQQLAAFQRDDGVAAFSYASPMIQRMFKTPSNFMSMVKQGYMPVYRPREVSFRDIVVINGDIVQRVLLVGPNNEVVVAHYIMQQQADGMWKINGCILKAADESIT